MNDRLRDLPDLAVNPDWARLPLFDRKGWRQLAFGEFAENVNERVEPGEAGDAPYVGLEHIDPQDLHIRVWGKASDVIGTKLRFRKGDVIFGRRRAYQRKLAVAEFDGICSAHAMVVRAKPDRILPGCLPFLMKGDTFMSRAVQISVGSLAVRSRSPLALFRRPSTGPRCGRKSSPSRASTTRSDMRSSCGRLTRVGRSARR